MKIISKFVLSAITILYSTQAFSAPLGTSFTYQGELVFLGAPANGSYDFLFDLFDVAEEGNPVASGVEKLGVGVTDGIFSVNLDFSSSPFLDQQLWLQVRVREGGSGGQYTDLLPRHSVTASPFALSAQKVFPNSVTATEIAPGVVGTAEVDSSEVQLRVTGNCPSGEYVAAVASDGGVICQTDDDSGLAEILHTHSAADVTSGVLETAQFDAYADLSASGRLDLNSSTDLLTRSQLDGRYASDSHDHTAGGIPWSVYVDPSTCQRGLAGGMPYTDVLVNNPPAISGAPGVGVASNAPAGSYFFYCPVPNLSSPFGLTTVTGGKMGYFDQGTACLVSVELKHQSVLSGANAFSKGIGFSGADSNDFASTPGLEDKNITVSGEPVSVTGERMMFLVVNIKRESTTIGDCQFKGFRVYAWLNPPP